MTTDQLIQKHYDLIRERGLIHPETSIDDFVRKMEEEYLEVLEAYADDIKAGGSPSGDFFNECTDLVMVIFHMMNHYGIDFRQQLRKNIEIQRTRVAKIS